MQQSKWNDGWKFWKDRDSFALVWNVPAEARTLSLPPDAMIEDPADPESPNGGNTGFRSAECDTYVKQFIAPEAWAGKTVLVKFEGVYMNALVYLNGQLVAQRPYGYSAFYARLDDYLRINAENELRVLVRAGAMPNSRWYSGAGIYRDVWLLTAPKTHIAPDGVWLETESADAEAAVVRLKAELENEAAEAKEVTLRSVISSAEGEAAADSLRVFLLPGEKRTLTRRLTILNPRLWSDEHPALYRVDCRLLEDRTELDRQTVQTGIRLLQLDAKHGLRVNGVPVKLRGGWIHHDSGLLGAATYEESQLRQVRLLKQAGFNALRMSHQPASPAMLRACDALGVYVMDELADMWTRPKSAYDYALSFSDWWERDVEAMVREDRSHPGVILYSIGNEIPEIGTGGGSKTAHEIAERFRMLDPTRYTTAGINGVFAAGDRVPEIVADIAAEVSGGDGGGNVNDFMTLMDSHMDQIVTHPAVSERLEMACANLDVAGYNYMTARYASDAVSDPNRIMVGSETYPPEIARNWREVLRLPQVIGDFTWTAWDYIGEAGVGIPAYRLGEGGFGARYPAQLAFCGDFDLTGVRRPASYFRQIVFGLRTAPYLAVQDPRHYGKKLIKTPWVYSDAHHSWTWPGCEGKPVVVEVCGRAAEAELLLNGTSLGRKPIPKDGPEECRALFDISYAPGTLTAVLYDEEGTECGRDTLETTGAPTSIVLTEEPFQPEDQLRFFRVTLADAAGRSVDSPVYDLLLQARAADGALLGFGSGDPKSEHNYNEGLARTLCGTALAVLQSPRPGQPISLSVGAEGLQSASVLLS